MMQLKIFRNYGVMVRAGWHYCRASNKQNWSSACEFDVFITQGRNYCGINFGKTRKEMGF